MFKEELSDGSINTESTPHYNSFKRYCEMLRDMGYNIIEERTDLNIKKVVGK
jgi:hypothetical protein